MDDNKKLNKVAKEVRQEIADGKKEITLDQPFPEDLKTNSTTEDESTSTSSSDTQNKNTEDAQDDDSVHAEEPDSKTDEPTANKARHFGRNINKLVLLFVGIGILICIIGVILIVAVGLLAGLLCLFIGASIIIFGVFAPPGY
jgi:uncharacterized membrane protein